MSEEETTTAIADRLEPATGTLPGVSQERKEELLFRYETRLAVVMYGGVSLAIYINGVAQELLHLVRASAPDRRNKPDGPRFTKLSPVEEVYREVICRLGSREALKPACDGIPRTRVIVDVIAGTSAGGLNGLFLAKALANGGDMESLKKLWIEEGDMERLLNDDESHFDDHKRAPPESLLNSPRMYHQLLRALRDMNGEGDATEPVLADELDLFVTATDLTGLPMPIRVGNREIYERRHKSVFHMFGAASDATGGSHNDFTKENDAFLAFAGRCTSSFPLAFEPMSLDDIARSVPTLHHANGEARLWKRFYSDYVRKRNEKDSEDLQLKEFGKRYFGDGGYLDNKPFSRAIDALQWRHAGSNVRRKLVYIEPSPEYLKQDFAAKEKPNAFQNLVGAASTLPRQETIREDLERVLVRNKRIDDVMRSVRFVPDDVRASLEATKKKVEEARAKARAELGGASQDGDSRPAKAEATADPTAPMSATDYKDQWLSDMVGNFGAAYGSYHRLKVAELTSELAEVVTRVAGLDERTEDFTAARMLMSAWRQEYYDSDGPEAPGIRESRRKRHLPEDWKSESHLLIDYDLSYRLRRIFFLSDIAQGLGALEPEGVDVQPHPDSPRYSQDRAKEILLALDGVEGKEVETCRRNLKPFMEVVREVLATLAAMHVELRKTGRLLRSRSGSPLTQSIAELGITRDERRDILDAPRARDQVARARVVLGFEDSGDGTAESLKDLRRRRRGILDAAARESQKALKTAFENATRMFEAHVPAASALGPAPSADDQAHARWIARRCFRFYYDRFEHYDAALFPMTYGADVGELAEVQTVRISPEDATGLIRERDAKGILRIRKLAGTRLGNFGAFLHATWRRSDILWGRLDAAEILLDHLLPPPANADEAAVRRALILRAQAAILAEELVPLGEEMGRRVFVEAFMHTERGFNDPYVVIEMLESLEPHLHEHSALQRLLSRPLVMAEHRRCFEKERELEARTAYRLGARATAIFGRILEQLSGPVSRASTPLGRYLAFAGRAVWGFVELAMPDSFTSVLFGNWMRVLYALEIMMVLGGAVFGNEASQRVGIQALVLTGGIHTLWYILQQRLRGSRKKNLLRRAILAIAFLGLLLAGVGAWMLPEFWARVWPNVRLIIVSMGFLK